MYAIRSYYDADAANAKTKIENGFDLTDYDKRTMSFAKEYSKQLLAIDINIDIDARITSYNVCYTKLLRKGF